MKKKMTNTVSVIMAFALLFVQTVVYANAPVINPKAVSSIDETVFELNETALNEALSELNELDAYLDVNQNATYQDVAQKANHLVLNVSPTPSPMGGDSPLGIPSFLWGCVFGVLGILLVYLMTDNDMDETKKALWGCLAGTAIILVVNFALLGAAGGAASAY
jgi:hypothetical protein